MNQNNNTIKQLNWRYAVKQFDSSRKLSPEQLLTVTEAMRLSASSFGLQGWKFIHVVNPAVRQQLKDASWGQSQVDDASEYFVFAAPTNYSNTDIDNFVNSTAKIRQQPLEQLTKFKEMLYGFLSQKSPDDLLVWLKKQIYLALGQTIATCAVEGIDTCPMEGFDPAKYDQILGLTSKNLTSVVCLAVGFRSPDDKYSQLAKVRFPADEVLITL